MFQKIPSSVIINSMEIERKFLVDIPPFELARDVKIIIQAYIFDDNGTCMRVRKINDKHLLTIKQKVESNAAKSAIETEIEIPQNVYLALLKEKYGNIIAKDRFIIDYMEYKIEMDVYAGPLEGLVTAEVEFKNEEEAKNFIAPSWFSKEITFDSKYTNASLANVNSLDELKEKTKVKK